MKRSWIVLAVALTIGAHGTAWASWVDYGGRIKSMMLYSHTDIVLVELDPPPTIAGLPAGCSTSYFAIDGAIPAERRQQMLSTLLTADALQGGINLTNDGTCVSFPGGGAFPKIVRVRYWTP